MRIAWGFPDADAAKDEREEEVEFQREQALLNWKSHDFHLFVGIHHVSEDTDPEIFDLEKNIDQMAIARISIKFSEPLILRRTAPELFNVLKDCGYTSPILCPEPADDNDDDPDEISLLGLEMHLPVEAISISSLSFTLTSLLESQIFVFERCTDEECFDHWNEDREE